MYDATSPQVNQRWTPKLVLEDALGIFDEEELCARYGLTVGELQGIRQLKPYQAALQKTRAEILEQGLSFKHKARVQAEMFLDSVMPQWINDPDAPLKDKLAALTKLVEWGELEPVKAQAAGGNGGFVFVLNLNGEQQTLTATPRVIDHQP